MAAELLYSAIRLSDWNYIGQVLLPIVKGKE